MFSLFGNRTQSKKQRTKLLWGREFKIVEIGLDEEQVVQFVNEILGQRESSYTSLQEPEREAKDTETGLEHSEKTLKKRNDTLAAEHEAQPAGNSVATTRSSETAGHADKESRPEVAIEDAVQEPVKSQDKAMAVEPSNVTAEKPLKRPNRKKAPDEEVTKPHRSSQDDQELYSNEVDIVVAPPVDLKMISNLYRDLQMIPELKVLQTSGSIKSGTVIRVSLEKPLPLISMIMSKMPEVEAIPESEGETGFPTSRIVHLNGNSRDGVKRIMVLKQEKSTSGGD